MCDPGHIVDSVAGQECEHGGRDTEEAMNRTIRPSRLVQWDQVRHFARECWRRSRSRHELATLDDTLLRDIGLSRNTAGFETSKPFWMV